MRFHQTLLFLHGIALFAAYSCETDIHKDIKSGQRLRTSRNIIDSTRVLENNMHDAKKAKEANTKVDEKSKGKKISLSQEQGKLQGDCQEKKRKSSMSFEQTMPVGVCIWCG